MEIIVHNGAEGFWFGDHFLRLVRDFTTEAGTTEDIGFVATDLAKALEIANSRHMVARLDPDQKGVAQNDTPGGTQSLTVISESGFYDVVVRSDKPQGKALRAVVTREILPQIRKTGGYRLETQALPASTPVDEAMKWIEFQSKLAGITGISSGLLVNAALEGCARQWPSHRNLIEPSKVAVAPTLEERQGTVTELANEYEKTEVGKRWNLRSIVEGKVWTLKRRTPPTMMNELLVRAGLQLRVEGDSSKAYEPTEKGRQFAHVIFTQTANGEAAGSGRTVQQVRWKIKSTLGFLESWVENNCEAA